MNRRIRTFFQMLACAALAGCKVIAAVGDAREAQNPAKVPAGERTVTAAEIGLKADSVLSLDEAIEIALRYHPSVVQAGQSLAVAEKRHENACAAYYPALDASLGYKRSTSNTTVKAASDKSHDSYSAGLGVQQLLYDFGRFSASVREAYEDEVAARESLRAAENKVAFDVRIAYYDLSKAQALLLVARDTERQFTVHLEQVRVLFEVGRRIKYDITKAEVDWDNARLGLINAANAVATSRAALNQALGLAEEPGYRIGEIAPEEFKADLAALMEAARKSQPELLTLKARQLAASAAVDGAIAELFPSLSLGAGYNWTGTDFPLVWNWSATGSFGWNLFNGFRDTRAIDMAVSELRSARAGVAGQEQQIYLDLSKALARLEGARRSAELTRLTVRLATENLDLVSERFRQGLASSVEVTDAQVSLSSARANQVQADYDYLAAVALIRNTTGER